MVSMYFLKSLPVLVLKYSLPTDLVNSCMLSTYFLKSLPFVVLKCSY
jgi:branched-subunit amino acid transport protein AzlD